MDELCKVPPFPLCQCHSASDHDFSPLDNDDESVIVISGPEGGSSPSLGRREEEEEDFAHLRSSLGLLFVSSIRAVLARGPGRPSQRQPTPRGSCLN